MYRVATSVRVRARTVLPGFCAILFLPAAVGAQMPAPVLSLGERDWTPANSCTDAPGACAGRTWDLDLGMHEFVLSRVDWFEPTEEVEVSLHWPPSWSLLGWESCSGTLLEGDPGTPGSALRFSFDDCPAGGPFLRVWMDCPVPGTFYATPGPQHTCWGYDIEEYMGLYVDIGDWCGAAPHGHCDLCAYRGAAGFFLPGAVDVIIAQGSIWSQTLGVSGDTGPWCPGLPECCPGWGAGFAGLRGEPAWIVPTVLDYVPDQGWLTMHYQLVIRGDLLTPGVHTGRVWANAGCCTRENCIPVTVTILDAEEVREAAESPGLLGRPYPNPTAGGIRFSVRLPRAGRARASIFDAGGRRVAIILDRELPAGVSVQQWRPSDVLAGRLSSGLYCITLETAAGRESRVFVVRK